MSEPVTDPAAAGAPPASPGRLALRRLRQNRAALAGLSVVVLIALLCVAGPWVIPHDPATTNLEIGASPPSAQHWLGTDALGRDLLVRILHGGRISFAVGLAATLVALGIGVAYGVLSGFAGGRTDAVMMRFVEVLYSMPFTIFVIVLVVFFGRHLWLIFVAIGAVEWLTMARIVRGQARQLRVQAFVEAATAMGAGRRAIIRRHLLPNLLGVVSVYATLTVPGVMLLEAFISFLGLGVQPPMTSWGALINEGAATMEEYPWQLIFPSAFFAATLLGLNFFGDGLRDALDPRSGHQRAR